jgi:hypothetical protein
MQSRIPAILIMALTVALAACGKRAEEQPAPAQTAQTTAASKSPDEGASGTTTNFESQQRSVAGAQPPGK